MNGGWSLTQQVAGLVAASLFLLVDLLLSAALVAVAALNRVSLHRMDADSSGGLGFLVEMQQPPSTHRSSAILMRQLCLLTASLLLVLTARGAGWPHPELMGFGLAAFVGVLALETLLARSVALRDPRATLRWTGFAVRWAHRLLYPAVRPWVLLLEHLGKNHQTEEQREEEQEQQVEALIEVGEREGLLEAEEGKMMRGIVDLDETCVREIMTPQPDIVAIPAETTVAEARRKLLDSVHSRLPVYRGSIDTVVGILHARDLFQAWEEQEEQQSVQAYVRPPTFVPETMSAAELLATMRLKTKVAMVVDEYGGVSGLVTLEDLLEEIVGEIRDEYEQGEEEEIQPAGDGSFLIHAGAHVEELERLFGVDFKERDFDTVGGLVVRAFGRVPTAGETLTTQGLRIEVLEADLRRIHRVRVGLLAPPARVRAES